MTRQRPQRSPGRPVRALLAALLLTAAPMALAVGNFAERPDVQAFIDDMVSRNGLDRGELLEQFRQARFEPSVIKAILPAASPTVRNWNTYRSRYIDARRISGGLEFWRQNQAALDRAAARYGVPPEIIVGIIGVETIYGRMMGKYQTFSALATLAFDYPPRAELFRAELEQLLLLARDSHSSPLIWQGSFAGALGMPQFLPSSLRKWAVDFNNDGRIDLAGTPEDAIGSVANFLKEHGWQSGGPVALPALLNGETYREIADGNVEPRWTPAELQAKGVTPLGGTPEMPDASDEKAALVDLVSPGSATEYWLGYRNFYVITRYNRSSFYAMTVYQLAQEVKKARKP